jgi:hypothetical protein
MNLLTENHWRSLGIRVEKPLNVFRYLVSKFLFSKDYFSLEDKVALFRSYEMLVKLCARDSSAQEKHYFFLFITRSLVQSLNNDINETEIRESFFRTIAPYLTNGRGYFSASIYYGVKGQIQKLYNIWIQQRFPKKFKSKRHIGVGYNDKGSAKNEARDGSPHWTEVASENGTENLSATAADREIQLWEELRIHENQRLVKTQRLNPFVLNT